VITSDEAYLINRLDSIGGIAGVK